MYAVMYYILKELRMPTLEAVSGPAVCKECSVILRLPDR